MTTLPPSFYVFGRWEGGTLDEPRVRALLQEARERQAALAARPIDDVLRVLEKVGRAWAAGCPQRVTAQERLPELLGFSAEMVALELDGLAMALSRPYLEAKLVGELGRLDAGDAWHRRPGTAGFVRAMPRGVTLHVASGNVATTGVLSLVEGLLARNVSFLKAASNVPLMPLLFLECLAEHDPEGILTGAVAVLGWSGERSKLHEVFCQEADAVVVWGGDEVLDTYRRAMGPHTKLIGWGPKVSAAFVGAEAVGLPATAAALARDVALWDQNACSSPQLVYCEGDVEQLVPALARELAALAQSLPMGALDLHERAEITKERELALAMEKALQERRFVLADFSKEH